MIKKLIALDLDGTLLNSASRISSFTKAVIQKVATQGHLIVITTGRPFRMAYNYYQELELNAPMINFNGSLTHIPGQKWAFEHERTLDKAVYLDILKREKEFQADFIASEYRKKFYVTHTNRDIIPPELFAVPEIEDSSELKTERITKSPNVVLMQTRHNDKYLLASEIEDFYRGHISVNTWGGPNNILECTPEGVNKAYALQRLLTVFNMDRSQLLAFGDEHNDKEMLAFAGMGYAMKNANPALLNYADRQLSLTNDEDGVAHQLQELFL